MGEPENLVLLQLREIGTKLDGIDRLEQQLAVTDRRVERLERHMAQLIGQESMARPRVERAEDLAELAVDRGKRTDARLESVEKRVTALEERNAPPR